MVSRFTVLRVDPIGLQRTHSALYQALVVVILYLHPDAGSIEYIAASKFGPPMAEAGIVAKTRGCVNGDSPPVSASIRLPAQTTRR